MRAAIEAAQFVQPKLAVTAQVNSETFAAAMERVTRRSAKVLDQPSHRASTFGPKGLSIEAYSNLTVETSLNVSGGETMLRRSHRQHRRPTPWRSEEHSVSISVINLMLGWC